VPLGLAVLMVASLLARTTGLATGYWIDEGLSVGIADRSPFDIPSVLRQDGSPPLYYLLLHAWMSVAGTDEVATHALSVACAVACVPAAWWALREPLGSRAAWSGAVLATLNPFLTAYAQETRMYALVVVLGVLACGAFLRALVLGRRGWRLPLGLLLAALLYTHNWALFFVAAMGAAWLWLLMVTPAGERRALLRDGLVVFGSTAVLYLPWLPTTIFQAAHTGAPWALKPPAASLPVAFERLLGAEAQYVLLVAAGAGVLAVLLGRAPGGLSGRGVDTDGRAAGGLIAVVAGTLLLAWLSSQLSPAWALRYLAVALAPLLLLAALGLSRAGAVGLAGLALVTVLWAAEDAPGEKSSVRDVAELVAPSLRPGDLVLSTQPEQIPVLAHYLPPGPRYATLWGPVRDVGVTDWRDGPQRLRATSPERDLLPLIEGLRPGRRLVLVEPIVYDRERWSAPWTELVRIRSVQWVRAAGEDRRLAATATYPATSYPARPNPVRATVFIRLPDE
jgi:hypothetical protein